MDGKEKAELQRVKGTRPIVEELDSLRMTFGFDQVKVLTPIVESRLRSGHEPPRALRVAIPLDAQSAVSVEFTLQIGYPSTPASICISSPEGSAHNHSVSQLESKISTISVENGETLSELVATLRDMMKSSSSAELAVDELHVNEIQKLHSEDAPLENTEVQSLPTELATTSVEDWCTLYCCKICGTVLFDAHQLHPHSQPPQGYRCTSYYLEDAPTWLNTASGDADKIYCGKCKARVGAWSWAGSQCSCEAWVTPAFQFVKSKVDEKFI